MDKALDKFIEDVFPYFFLVLILAGFVWFFWKRTVTRHDVIIKFAKDKGWELLDKQWHGGLHENDGIYYTIKYCDEKRSVHTAKVFVDELTKEVFFLDKEIY